MSLSLVIVVGLAAGATATAGVLLAHRAAQPQIQRPFAWSRAQPVQVLYDPALQPHQVDALRAAVDTFTCLGHDLQLEAAVPDAPLVIEGKPASGRITVTSMTPHTRTSDAGATTLWSVNGSRYNLGGARKDLIRDGAQRALDIDRVRIELDTLYDAAGTVRAATHELGHALGYLDCNREGHTMHPLLEKMGLDTTGLGVGDPVRL